MAPIRKVLAEKFYPKSSIVEYLIYRYEEEVLEVKFRKGSYRVYSGMSESELWSILNADSIGRALLAFSRTRSGSPKRTSFLTNLIGKASVFSWIS